MRELDDAKESIDLTDSKALRRQNIIENLKEQLDELAEYADSDAFSQKAQMFVILASRALRD